MVGGPGGSSALSEAISAVALTSLANRSRLKHLVIEGRQAYGNALQLVNNDLRNDAKVFSDRTLASVLCLDFYEVR